MSPWILFLIVWGISFVPLMVIGYSSASEYNKQKIQQNALDSDKKGREGCVDEFVVMWSLGLWPLCIALGVIILPFIFLNKGVRWITREILNPNENV